MDSTEPRFYFIIEKYFLKIMIGNIQNVKEPNKIKIQYYPLKISNPSIIKYLKYGIGKLIMSIVSSNITKFNKMMQIFLIVPNHHTVSRHLNERYSYIRVFINNISCNKVISLMKRWNCK